MPHTSRRALARSLGLLGLGALLTPAVQARAAKGRLVVVGGGFGGATLARFCARLLPSLKVTLVERDEHYVACPFSNLVLAGHRDIGAQMFEYAGLARSGVDVVRASAVDVDTSAREVVLDTGARLRYDTLALAPGIDFRWNALEGYDAAAAQHAPHAWKAGAQTELLRRQLRALPAGGVVAISVTAAPFRCPPVPTNARA